MRYPNKTELNEIIAAVATYLDSKEDRIEALIDGADIIVTPGHSHKLQNCRGPVFVVLWPTGAEINTVLIRNNKGEVVVLTDCT